MCALVANKETYDFLHRGCTRVVRDPLWTAIGYDEACSALLESPTLMKLHNIRQLGPTALVYPGATHTRYSHSLGVMHLARLVLLELMKRKHCPRISVAEAKAFLAAALLHDVGHFPYTHSLKELPLPPHEEISAALISGNGDVLEESLEEGAAARLKTHVEKSPLPALLTQWGVAPPYAAAIVSNKLHAAHEDERALLTMFRTILSGALDPDKLDYLCRDAFFCGVPYGIQDVDFAIRSIDIDENMRICLKSYMPTEHILFSKYLMYKSVYWHSKVRAATAMVKHALFHAITKTVIMPHELLFLTDEEFHTLCRARVKNCEKLALVDAVRCGSLHACLASCDVTQEMHALESLPLRSACEAALSQHLGIPHVIIDLPERIAFESPYDSPPVPIEIASAQAHHTEKHENHNATVFDQHTAAHFSTVLRRLRVFVPQSPKAEGLMHNVHIGHIVQNEIQEALGGA